MWFVYLIECEDKSIYTGAASDLKKRLEYHRKGWGGEYTLKHKPLKIIHSETFKTKREALKRERQIKGWRKDKKLKLANRQNESAA